MKSSMIVHLLVLLLLTTCGATRLCRDGDGISLTSNVYNGWTCAKCYEYLFPRKNIVAKFPYYLVGKDNITSLHPGTVKTMHVRRSGDRRKVCETLNTDQCLRWRRCCRAAVTCCHSQKSRARIAGRCPATWDGYVCWSEAAPGTVSHTTCPTFIPFSLPNRFVVKRCGEDGHWLSVADREWTDYRSCLNRHFTRSLRLAVYAAISLSSVSLVLLVTAILIFLVNSAIRSSAQVSLYHNLFGCLFLLHSDIILWEWFVTHDRLSNGNLLETQLHKNDILCKAIWLTSVFMRSAAYAWFLANNVHFRNFVSHDFASTNSVLPYYILAWGVPTIVAGVYGGLRVAYNNSSCWSENFGIYKWVESGPNLVCLLMSVVFILDTIRLLFIRTHLAQNEPQYVRRSCLLRLLLVSVFGVQSAVTVVSLPPGAEGYTHYENFRLIVNNTHGAFVAILLCFLDVRVTRWIRLSCSQKKHRKKLSIRTDVKLLTDNSTDTSGTKSPESGLLLSTDSDVTNTSNLSTRNKL